VHYAYAYLWVTRGVKVLAGVLPTGPIRISYNKFCYYAENRHLLHRREHN